mmetsp:Transcript_13439/g.37814  ORF Transcript_13439/g.37814 Transcript_13439/m.37814 type:complete len:353 (-) Transcript_13439:644-1702(-)
MTVVPCSWEIDGSTESRAVKFAESSSGGTTIDILGVPSTQRPVNLMAANKEELSSASSYWFAVMIAKKHRGASVSVGVVTPTEFRPGYQNKGMFYNGNLTNCSSGLAIGYGPYLDVGDRCVIECTNSARESTGKSFFSMTIYLNGSCIGKGFEIENPSRKGFFPCVSITGKVKLDTVITTEKPSDIVDKAPISRALDGKWVITEATNQSDLKYLPIANQGNNDRGVTMNIDCNGGKEDRRLLSLSVTAMNRIATSMEYQSNDEETLCDVEKTDGVINYHLMPSGQVASTMMMARPPYDRVEAEISLALRNGWKTIQFIPHQSCLNILNVDGAVIARCVRHENNDASTLKSYC